MNTHITPNMPWPPTHYTPALNQIRHDHHWLTGNPPTTSNQQAPYTHPLQHNGGILGSTARLFLGKPTPNPQHTAHTPYHLPVAKELVTTSANILLGQPPQITLNPKDQNPQAQQALSDLTTTDEFADQLHQAAITCTAYGWIYARIAWNTTIQPHPWIEFVDPDQGITTFTGNKQTETIIWEEYTHPNNKHTYRLLQHHTPGRITYQLYEGDHHNLGHLIPVTDHPETQHLATILDQNSGINTGTHLPTAIMIPNNTTNPAWRTNPLLKHYGHSDIAAAGTIWETLNKAWTDLWHEVDISRARLMVSEDLLRTPGVGQGQYFEWFRDIFPLAPTATPDTPPTIEKLQFNMRVQEYATAVDFATRKAVDAVGLSPITVGLEQGNANMTATEIRARSTRTLDTFNAKSRKWRSGLSQLLTAYLALDADLNGYTPPQHPVNVALVEPIQETETDRARTVQLWRNTGMVSLQYGVRKLHPEWTDSEVDEEVQRIREDTQTPTLPTMGE